MRVNQPSFMPTNKLTSAMLAGAAWEIFFPLIDKAGGLVGISLAASPNLSTLIMFGLMLGTGYMVKDRANVGS